MKYSFARNGLESGDVVLFQGDTLVGFIIRWWCSLWHWLKNTKYSHVGLVWVEGEGENKRYLIFESTQLTTANGVQLNVLSERIKGYKKVVVRSLVTKRDKEFYECFRTYIAITLGVPYETDLLELAKSAHQGNNAEDTTSLFCSELATEVYQTLRLVRPAVLSNNTIPDDYAFGGLIDGELRFAAEPACLMNEIEVTI